MQQLGGREQSLDGDLILAPFDRRRGYMPPGGSNRMTPDDSSVIASSGRHCSVWVRVWPSGNVTVNVGA